MEGRSMSNDRALHRSQKRRVTTFYSVLLDLPIITFVTQRRPTSVTSLFDN